MSERKINGIQIYKAKKKNEVKQEERVSANRHLKSSCPIRRNPVSRMRRWWHTTMRHTVTKQKTYKIVETYLRPRPIYIYIHFLPLDPVSLSTHPSGHSVNLDFSLTGAHPRTTLSAEGRMGACLGAPLSRPWGATRMAWTGHPLTLGVLPGPNPPRWSKQAETWPDPRTSPAWGHRGWPRGLHGRGTVTRPPIKSKFVSSRGLEAGAYRWGGRGENYR